MDDWYAEEADYDYNNPGFSMATGHFTQVVWKSSTEVGCGVAQTQNGSFTVVYVVCQYTPPGNFTGRFPENVLQP